MKRKIAIIAGGDSSEYEVSLRSAAGIYSFMDKERYELTVVRLHGHDWQALPDFDGSNPEVLTEAGEPIDKNDFSFTRGGVKHTFDFAYITIHGTPGENGILQGYLDMIGMPYSCCGVLAAALTFNKYACNHYLSYFGFHIANSMMLRAGQKWPNAPKIAETLGLPCFIKSNIGGSSFGCTKVKTVEEVYPAIERAFQEGDEVICESYMKGTEVTCGVYKTKDKAVAFPITEVVTHNEFFDYNAKYKGEVDEITPARIPDEVRDKIQAETLRLYDIIGANGIIRVDWIITKTATLTEDRPASPDRAQTDSVQLNLLEVNTTPGMTPTSFIPQQVRAAGLDIKDVLTDIIENKFN
ncbi:MAG: D-alanine--D-alanine ligase [Paludibacteraceae bacterium]|nr:D-alanine--D-alanine ligase [Paludibacteraceae bacterium]